MSAREKDVLDFIVIGAQKAGTTSLYEYMRQHPEISVPAAKEAFYFNDDERIARGWDVYLDRHFGLASPRTKWGTFTPQYMWGGISRAGGTAPRSVGGVRAVPERIRDQTGTARLIAILRDPVERAISHHAMAAMNGSDSRSASEALRERLRPAALTEARASSSNRLGYLTFGEYGRILAGYYDTFAADQILVLYLADLQRDPGSVVRRIFEFVGVGDPGFVPENLGTVYRPRATERRVPLLERHRLRHAAGLALRPAPVRAAWTRLSREQRIRVTQAFDGATYRLDLWNRRDPAGPAPAIEADLAAALREHFRDDAALLATLTGTRPPWST